MFKIHKIVGDSMSPTIQENDYVVSHSWLKTRYKKGDIVLIDHTQYLVIIKRVLRLNNQGEVWLKGDNVNSSVSSEEIDWQSQDVILGKVFFHVSERKANSKKKRLNV